RGPRSSVLFSIQDYQFKYWQTLIRDHRCYCDRVCGPGCRDVRIYKEEGRTGPIFEIDFYADYVQRKSVRRRHVTGWAIHLLCGAQRGEVFTLGPATCHFERDSDCSSTNCLYGVPEVFT